MKNLDLATYGVEEMNEVQMQEVVGGAKEGLLYASIGCFALAICTGGASAIAGVALLGAYNGYNS